MIFLKGNIPMKKILDKKYGLLVFSLLSGFAYFTLIMILISEVQFSYLLGIFFFPTVVCGAALCLVKSIKLMLENQEEKKAYRIMKLHIALIIFACFFGITMLFV